jgi:hypothetical protein
MERVMGDEFRIFPDPDQIHYWVERKDRERVGFASEAAAQNYIDRGGHLQPIKKDIKTYVEGVEIPTPSPQKPK